MDTLKTGDLILFDDEANSLIGYFGSLIKWCTHSAYTHIGMVLKDPVWIHPSLNGLYLWESSFNGTPDPQDGKIKLGVQVTPLHELLDRARKTSSRVFVRRIQCPPEVDTFKSSFLKVIHTNVYDKPYDILPSDWVDALLRKDLPEGRTTERFWCSALVGYIYTALGILKGDTDWSIMRPSDFSLDEEHLNFSPGYSLGIVEERLI